MPTTEELKALFSSRLSALLNEHNINQVDLAKILGVSESTVGKWMLMKSLPRIIPVSLKYALKFLQI